MKKSLKILLGVMLVLASMAILFTRVNAEESKPTIEMTVDGSFYVGISKEFTISTTRPENYNGGKVYGTGGVEDESVLDKFEVLDYTGWKNLKGETLGNSDEGFDLTTGSLKFRATFNKAGEYNVKYVLKEVGTDNVVAENSIVLKVEEPSINMTVDGNFYVGKSQNFSISTVKPEGYPETKVLGIGSITDESGNDATSALDALQYKEVNGEDAGKWKDVPEGYFGVSEGFPLANATSEFRATFKKAGTYTVKYAVKKAEDTGVTVAENSLKINVYEDTLDSHLTNETGSVSVKASSDEIISKEVLNELKNGEPKDVEIVVNDGEYIISFNTANITEDFTNDLSLNIDVTETEPFESDIWTNKENTDYLFVDIEYSGNLPKGTIISINAKEDWEPGDKVYLYYYNETTKKAELVAKDLYVSANGGRIKLPLDHASTYFLSKTELPDEYVSNNQQQGNNQATDEGNNVVGGVVENNVTNNTTAESPKTGDVTIVIATALLIIAIVGFVYAARQKKLLDK